MKFSLSELNRKKVLVRWSRVHTIQEDYIKKNNINFLKARILGYIAGDGNISVRTVNGKTQHHAVRFFPDHSSLIKVLSDAFVRVYNKKPIIKKEHNFYILKVYSKPIVLDILKYAKFGIHIWCLPNILLIDKKSKQEWLRAFFDAEAYVGKDHIKLHSVNKNGLIEIKNMLLKDFNIETKMYQYVPKNPNYSIQHILMITSKTMRTRYLDEIGFNHKVKIDKLLTSLR